MADRGGARGDRGDFGRGDGGDCAGFGRDDGGDCAGFGRDNGEDRAGLSRGLCCGLNDRIRDEETAWVLVMKLNGLVKENKIKSMEPIYFHSLPVS